MRYLFKSNYFSFYSGAFFNDAFNYKNFYSGEIKRCDFGILFFFFFQLTQLLIKRKGVSTSFMLTFLLIRKRTFFSLRYHLFKYYVLYKIYFREEFSFCRFVNLTEFSGTALFSGVVNRISLFLMKSLSLLCKLFLLKTFFWLLFIMCFFPLYLSLDP